MPFLFTGLIYGKVALLPTVAWDGPSAQGTSIHVAAVDTDAPPEEPPAAQT